MVRRNSKQIANEQFNDSAQRNKRSYIQYYDRLQELSLSMFEWKNLPESIDPRFMELALFNDGAAVFFYDEDLEDYLALQVMYTAPLDVYRIPIERKAFASNGYQKPLDKSNSVIIWNNYLHTNCVHVIDIYAQRLANLDRTMDINIAAHKTPMLISCDESQRLTLKNLYMKYDGNMPVIFGDKNINPNSIQAINTGAPYIADKLYLLRTEIWNEALTYLGISNVNIQKRERMLQDEVKRNQGGVIASRYPRLEARRQACRKINEMFGLNIWVDYREDYQIIDESADETTNPNEHERRAELERGESVE